MENNPETTEEKKDKELFEKLNTMFQSKDKVNLSHNTDKKFDKKQYEKNADDSLENFSKDWISLNE